MIRVMVISADVRLIGSVADVLGAAADVLIVAELPSAAEAAAELSQSNPDVLLAQHGAVGILDIGPEHPILAPLARIPRVLLIARGQVAAAHILNHGALALVIAERLADELIPAVRAAAEGDRFTSPEIERSAADPQRIAAPRAVLLSELTPREREVFELFCEGCSLARAADRLGLSRNTVKVHRSRLIGKLQLRTAAELTRFIYKHGLDR